MSATPRVIRLTAARAVALPLAIALGLLAFCATDAARVNPRVLWSIAAAAALLPAWTVVLAVRMRRTRHPLTLEMALRPQHYVQACAQGSVLLYWAWYWPPAQNWAPFIAAQLLFAYGFDMLLSWTRTNRYLLGFGPFPVIFSINLFLWFKPDWLYLQFAMVALGFAAKQLIHWNKDGRRTHVFNPSSFALAAFSIVLLATGTTGITYGPEIAVTQFYPPAIYLMLFLIGLPGQFFFGVTSMTMAAVVATYVFGLLYFAATGVYFFYDSYIPIAVFLGMHLLFTDPSTSPRTELGRLIFGALYGLSTVALYAALSSAGLPTFYDKLLQVPILNLSIKWIDRLAGSSALAALDPGRLATSLAPRQRNLAYISVWTLVFAAISAANGVGDRHPGQWLPFWQQACAEGRHGACEFLAARLTTHCGEGSGWACNELGSRHSAALAATEIRTPAGSFERGCKLGFRPACGNLLNVVNGEPSARSAPPTLADYPIILRGSKKELPDATPAGLYITACEQGWAGACEPPAEASVRRE